MGRGGRSAVKRNIPSPTSTFNAAKKGRKSAQSLPSTSTITQQPTPTSTITHDQHSTSAESDTMLTSDDNLSTIHTRSSSSSSKNSSNSHLASAPTLPAYKPRIPPIILDIDQWKSSASKIMAKFTKHELIAKFTNNSLHLLATNSDTFREAQRTLSDLQITFHTFSLPSERQLKVLLRGIPTFHSEAEVKDELSLLGFDVTHTRQFLKEGRKLPMFMVTLPNTPCNKEIFQLDTLLYAYIKVEPYKTSGPSQCFACQGFGHSSANCNHSARCVKCAGNHPTKECKKTADDPPKCCNCGGEHTANYRKCPTYSNQVEILEKSRKPNNHHQSLTPAVTINTNPVTQISNHTYADITKNQTSNTTKNQMICLLTETIQKIADSNDIKLTITTALTSMLTIIQYV